MAQNETARTTVYLDGKQAESALAALADKAKSLTKDLKEAQVSGDNVKFNKIRAELSRVESAQRSVTKESFDVQNVLMNINKVSWKDLEKAQTAIRSQFKKMIPETEEYIKKAEELRRVNAALDSVRASTHATTGFMGRLTQSLDGMTGPVGSVINGLISTGKAMWALVANPIGATIALIVGSLTLLYKAFTSTDEGAVAMEGTLKSIGNVMDILIDRAMSYYKMLWSLVSFDWEGVKKNAKDAFGGIVDATKDAVNAGWDYAKAMDDINDREVAAANRMTKLRVDIETLKNKVQKLSGKEKLAMLKEAMDKEVELNGIETRFLAERNAAETSNLASKIQDNKLSLAQKEEQLKKWLAIDDKELAGAMANDAAFAEFENKNEEEFQKLQKTKADEIMKQAELQSGTRRLQNKLATEELQEGVKAQKAALENEKEQRDLANAELKAAYEDRLLIIKTAYLKEGWTKEEYEARLELAGIAHLEAQKQLLILQKEDTTAIETEIADARIKIQTDAFKIMEDMAIEQKDTINDSVDEMIKSVDESIAELEKIKKKEEQLNQSRGQTYSELAINVGESLGDLLTSQEKDFGQFLRNTLVMALDALEKTLLIKKTEAIINATALGPLAVLVAVGKLVAMTAAFGVAKAVILGGSKGKQSGGFSENGSDDEVDGFYHKNEFVASGPAVRNPTIKPILDIIDIAQRSGTIRSLNLPAMIGYSGRQSGGYASPSPASSGSPVTMISGRDTELTSAIIELNRHLRNGIKANINKFGTGSLDEGMNEITKFNSKIGKK